MAMEWTNRVRLGAMALAGMAAAALPACKGGGDGTGPTAPSGVAACSGTQVLTVSPVVLSALQFIAPLGNLNPSGHVFPTDHIYLYSLFASGGSTPAAVVSPGNITITTIARQTRSGGGQPDFADYSMQFFPCADVFMNFGHLSSLSADLLAQAGSFDAGCTPSYVTGGFTYQQCYKATSIRLAAGATIGTMGGPSEGALDLGAFDRRTTPLAYVDPGRVTGGGGDFTGLHDVCPIDYFSTGIADAMRALLGLGAQRRTVAPVCGTAMQDVANTAQGRWYFGSTTNDDPHLALVHDNVNPAQPAFSVGTSVPSVPAGVYLFTPAATGRLNADFDRVTADGNIYCYQLSNSSARHIFVQLVSSNTLKIEGVVGSACGDPTTWSFTAAAVQFQR
jgi:hypothetical protein